MAPPPFALRLVEGVAAERARLDQVLAAAVAPAWTLERLSAIDRNVLRIAAFELSELADVPLGVVVDEAVELAKRYSTERSGAFVNGVLSAVAATLRPGAAPTSDAAPAE